MKATVVNVKREPCQVYIGRVMKRLDPASRTVMHMGEDQCGLHGLWGNPFGLDKVGREESIMLYAQLMRLRLGLVRDEEVDPRVVAVRAECRQDRNGMPASAWRAQIALLHGKVLGCWCKPEACHGDVLVELAAEVVGLKLNEIFFTPASMWGVPGKSAAPVVVPPAPGDVGGAAP